MDEEDTGAEQEQPSQEEQDWLSPASHERARRKPDYQRNARECDACQ
jgi:hypothetical protein